jgi:hypothetical protein
MLYENSKMCCSLLQRSVCLLSSIHTGDKKLTFSLVLELAIWKDRKFSVEIASLSDLKFVCVRAFNRFHQTIGKG